MLSRRFLLRAAAAAPVAAAIPVQAAMPVRPTPEYSEVREAIAAYRRAEKVAACNAEDFDCTFCETLLTRVLIAHPRHIFDVLEKVEFFASVVKDCGHADLMLDNVRVDLQGLVSTFRVDDFTQEWET